MEKWISNYRLQAERIINLGFVREINFSGPTYQTEIYDPEMDEIRWPFLQFDDQGNLKDAFCSCPSENGKCLHLAVSYFAILGPEHELLHERFENSFWNHFCQLLGDHSGYEERFLKKKAEGVYFFHNEVYFEIEAKTKDSKHFLSELAENRLKETPENSIKFSNLSQEEIAKWREGRPSPSLRYSLSFWSDLAKWMLHQTQEAKIYFQEDSEGFPTFFKLDFPSFYIRCELRKKDLPKLIPFLDSINSPLKLFQSVEEKVKNITFDPQTSTFFIEHSTFSTENFSNKALYLEGWIYLQGLGFYPKNGHSLLSHNIISKQEAPLFLESFHLHINQYIPIHKQKIPLLYSMYFDSNWDWHFTAYLREKGDLLRPDTALIGKWVFINGKGFYPIEDALFDQVEVVLPASKVSNFVNHHRIWLNGQEGFQTHLASIETALTYTVTDTYSLRFHTKTHAEELNMMDFGDWIYYMGQGFFSKKHARIGHVIRPGLEIKSSDVSQFIKTNREELEAVSRFFTATCPLIFRGLEITNPNRTSLEVKPFHQLKENYSESEIHIFGDFVYLKNEGFFELPVSMRIPDRYTTPVTFSHFSLSLFFESEFPFLMKFCQKIDPALLVPHKMDLTVNSLIRTESGGRLKTDLFYKTEYGKVAVVDLLEAIENKKRYCFTEAGLIDLHAENFQWIKHFKTSACSHQRMMELSTLEFIKLDVTFGLLGPTDENPQAQITRQLLKELREFTSYESPNLVGLTSNLRLYQQTGLHWLWFLYKNGLSGLLCDDMGLGKTHQAMALIAATLNQKPQESLRYLVVCPTSVIYHWQDKLETFLPHLKVHTFYGLKRSLKHWPNEGLILTSYGILRMERKKLEQISFEIAIFDEVQIAKNPHSRIHAALKGVRSRMSIGLTGTPIENNLRELKALFDIVLPGYMPSEARFRELFITPIERDSNVEKKALLSQMIRPFVLRRKKTEVLQELPEKSEDKSYCDLSKEQIELYLKILSQTRDLLIADLKDQNASVNYVHIFSLLSQLKQVCNHPALIYKDPANYKAYSSGKWDLFIELLEEARESDQKVVIFSQYLYMLDIIENYLKERGWGYAQIRGDTLNRREEIKNFLEDPNCVVFIGSLQAAGLGIDLTSASVVIMYDRWWNAAKENQAIDRVHRIGQKWGVQVYKLITKNTIEEKIDRMISHKGRLLEDIVTADGQTLLKKFTRSELIELLNFSID